MPSFRQCLSALLGSACLQIALRALGANQHAIASGDFCGSLTALSPVDHAFVGLRASAAVRVIVELSYGSVA